MSHPSFEGRVASKDAEGLNGGVCILVLEAGTFQLSAECSYIYSIEKFDRLTGTWEEAPGGLRLDAATHYGYTWETTKQEWTKKVSRRIEARFVGPAEDPKSVLELPWDGFGVLRLQRQATR